MNGAVRFCDIHCHLLPDIDDGARSWQESLAMAQMAAGDGIGTIIATPHQLGSFVHNHGETIRARTAELQRMLDQRNIPLSILPGADVRIEAGMVARIGKGEVLTLGDLGKHVLLELPHELYFPLDEVLNDLARAGLCGILSHPERNQGLLKQPQLIEPLIEQGCLMQVTCGSLMGTFGAGPQQMAEWMVQQGLVHFMATDAHGSSSRRPLMYRAFEQVMEMVGEQVALDVCCHNPSAVAAGAEVRATIRRPKAKTFFGGLFKRRRVA